MTTRSNAVSTDNDVAKPVTTWLKDYRRPDFRIETVALRFELVPERTRVTSTMQVRRVVGDAGETGHAEDAVLVLNGCDLELEAIRIDARPLSASEYSIVGETLTIARLPASFELEIVTIIDPASNTSLEGLYVSSGNFCTQCEAEGFRRITWYPDRPDVMAVFTTTLIADKDRFPVLLSNGNRRDSGELDNNQHWITWHDPHPKPAYLFALVAGDLAVIEDSYTTASGREVALGIYVQARNIDRCEHAMRSLQQAMRWDEQVFGLECDLDSYKIVAVDDFNMGAMENKGLNIFNSSCVLARPETATDADFHNIQGIIGHEYFHNWTGNRVTCRDWFQLSLKEGLTVFRDQQFSADMASRPVTRIGDVRMLRTGQFAEDAGPMAHPVRPESYIEISNFYTATVYNKGAEVIRMMHTLLGAENFRKGMDLYFERHDGQAVTTEDFARAMQDASGIDLTQFRRWYSQAGTPRLDVSAVYHADTQVYALTIKQSCPPTPGQTEKLPFHLPFAMGLLTQRGEPLALQLEGEASASGSDTRVLDVTASEQTFRFINVPEAPVPSLLRNFSAPVKLEFDYDEQQLQVLLQHDTDAFNRWEAGQRLLTSVLLSLVDDYRAGRALAAGSGYIDALSATLASRELEPALIAEALQLPTENLIGQMMSPIDVDAIHAARTYMLRQIAQHLEDRLLATYHAAADTGPYQFNAAAMGQRSLKNLCLAYLLELDSDQYRDLALQQFRNADNMTDQLAAMRALQHDDSPARKEVLDAFYQRWQDDALVLDKWFSLQAGSRLPATLAAVRKLLTHPAFDSNNPNKVRALIGVFCHANQARFHEASGEGYRFLADQILLLDPRNPQIAARLLGALSRWRQFDPDRQRLMREQLERIVETPGLSTDSYEIAAKSLA